MARRRRRRRRLPAAGAKIFGVCESIFAALGGFGRILVLLWGYFGVCSTLQPDVSHPAIAANDADAVCAQHGDVVLPARHEDEARPAVGDDAAAGGDDAGTKSKLVMAPTRPMRQSSTASQCHHLPMSPLK